MTIVAVQHRALASPRKQVQVEIAVVVEVGRQAHQAGPGAAQAHGQRFLAQGAVSLVAEEQVGIIQIGHLQV